MMGCRRVIYIHYWHKLRFPLLAFAPFDSAQGAAFDSAQGAAFRSLSEVETRSFDYSVVERSRNERSQNVETTMPEMAKIENHGL